MEPATDLDILKQRGFREEDARKALLTARGDIRQAILLLTSTKANTSWLAEIPGEWEDNVNNAALPQAAESRALWKSPYYVRVGSFKYDEEKKHVYYILTVIARNSRQYTIEKRYSDFYSFWLSLPMGTCNGMAHTFPQSIFSFTNKEEKAEAKRAKLEEWMREFCLNERLMTNPKILALLSDFLEVSKMSVEDTTASIVVDSWVAMPSNQLNTFPVTIEELSTQLPCKVYADALFTAPASSITGSDSSMQQLIKDISRDRVVIQGKRIAGSKDNISSIISTAKASIEALLPDVSLPAAILESYCYHCLSLASRTESAYTSHTALHYLLQTDVLSSSMIVPEGSLAKPLQLQFRYNSNKSRGSVSNGKSPAKDMLAKRELFCDIQATTVYRFMELEGSNTLLQLQVTYCKCVKLNVDRPASDFVDSRTILIFDKVTTTTGRDWKTDQGLC